MVTETPYARLRKAMNEHGLERNDVLVMASDNDPFYCGTPRHVAAFLVGYGPPITQFDTADRYAAYNGTAPIEVSSGGKGKHRLSRRGNRTLNHAIHAAAVTQISHQTPGRVYYDKKLDEGKTNKEALRALKRRISNVVYRQLIADAQRHRG